MTAKNQKQSQRNDARRELHRRQRECHGYGREHANQPIVPPPAGLTLVERDRDNPFQAIVLDGDYMLPLLKRLNATTLARSIIWSYAVMHSRVARRAERD